MLLGVMSMRCTQCGKENPDDARFCAYCGTSLVVVCSSCNAANPAGAAECAQCGARDFISLSLYEIQLAEIPDIIENLPPELRALFPEKELVEMSAQEAIEHLFG